MTFVEMRTKMLEHFAEMTKGSTELFEVSLDKDKLWDLYLESFPPEKNKIFRERREHDCSCCRHFIKTMGSVSLKGMTVNEVLTYATGKSELYDTLREGIVFRSLDGKQSFKAVSPEFLIKNEE